jgi:hypothetical protein
MISPSLTAPPVPQKDFKLFPNVSKSFKAPANPSTKVTALPARFLNLTALLIFVVPLEVLLLHFHPAEI